MGLNQLSKKTHLFSCPLLVFVVLIIATEMAPVFGFGLMD